MITGDTIRLLRTLKGVKQKTIAKALGISQPAYSKLENCPSLQTRRVEKIIELLNCDIEYVKRIEHLKKAI